MDRPLAHSLGERDTVERYRPGRTPAAKTVAARRRTVLQETLVCASINSLLPAGAIWLLDKAPPRSLLTGDRPMVVDIALGAGLATFLMTVMLTGSIRARVRKGLLAFQPWPVKERGPLRWLPLPLVWRAASLALLATLLVVPAALALVWGLDMLPGSRGDLLLFNLAFGAAVGIGVGPIIAMTALADPPSGQANMPRRAIS